MIMESICRTAMTIVKINTPYLEERRNKGRERRGGEKEGEKAGEKGGNVETGLFVREPCIMSFGSDKDPST